MSVKQIFNTSAELDYPTVLPTLDLDFANSKTLDPRITFTRASGGSYVGADGLIKLAGVNEPRFDHDPYTGESLGFLVEEARTNLITYSQQFDNAAWVRQTNTTVTANTHVAPDGTTTADTINAISNQLIGIAAVTASTTYTVSVFIRKTTGATIFPMLIVDQFTSGAGRVFNTNTGQLVVRDAALNTGTQCESVGDYWRVSYSGNVGANTTLNFLIYPAASTDGSSYIGGLAGSIIAWGAQLEAGTFPTSYIPTEGSSRTRSADVASITGKNFSSWFNPSGFTVVSDCQGTLVSLTQNNTGSGYPYIFSFGQWGNRLVGVRSAGGFNGSWSVYSQPPGIFAYSTNANFNSVRKHKVAAAYNLLDYLAVADGIIGTSITPAADPTLFVNFYLGRGDDGGFWGGTISRLTYYPKRLTDAQLQVLTS